MSQPISVIGSPGTVAKTVRSMRSAFIGAIVESQFALSGTWIEKPGRKLQIVWLPPGIGMQPEFQVGGGIWTSSKAPASSTQLLVGTPAHVARYFCASTLPAPSPPLGETSPSAPFVKIATPPPR